MNKILIVGSKGFIGSNLGKYLNILASVEVWGCDVVTDYGASNYYLIDASNSDFEELFQAHSFDICFNCSGSASVPDSLLHPLRDFYLNSLNVFKMAEAIRKYRPECKFLNISSAAVYGNPEQLPIKETAALMPISPYGYHKLQSENICEEFNRFYNIQTCSVRIFSAYGNGLKKQLFWDISQKLSKNNEVVLFGTGMESRDFIHIDSCKR
jgi:UDP-glucose 4-epimerase